MPAVVPYSATLLALVLLAAAPLETKRSRQPLPTPGTGLIIGGSLSLAASAGFATASIVLDHRVRRSTRDINEAMLVATSTAAFATGVTGVVLMTLGVRRRRSTMVAPTLSSTFGGITITGRF